MKRNHTAVFCVFSLIPALAGIAQESPAPPPAAGLPSPGERPLLPPQQNQKAPIVPGVNNQKGDRKMTGPTVSDSKIRSGIVEMPRPERVPVYPDDPESAWWEINPRYAFLRAQREQKPLLLLFTADWNTQALRLSEEVFATKSFNEYVKEKLVICYLNYPRNITDAPDSMRNVKKKFKIKGYPNVLIFNPEGEVETHVTGYRTGRPVDYFQRMKAQIIPILQKIESRKKKLAEVGYREWSGGEKGITIFAKFLRRDPDLITLQGVNGERWTVAMKTLSEEDRKIAESFPTFDKVAAEE
ncbi:MAG: hypothetical protein HKN23_22235 [Verrucomicrobiales bacterium]|nr:hypothetical protein [Verrucomicrobiales bacterium]